MVVYNSPDILQKKINDLFNGFEFIRAYIDYILVLPKVSWIYHIHKSELLLNKLKRNRIIYDFENYFLIQTKMKYFGFWVRHDGIKPTGKGCKQ